MKNSTMTLLCAVFLSAQLFAQPVNDDICDAIELSTDGSVGVYSNEGAGTIDAEAAITPPLTDCEAQDGWCDAEIRNSVWFYFLAIGTEATITTCHDETTYDNQVAVYSGTDCTDFGTLALVGANDDAPGGCVSGGSTWASELNLSGLAIGETYWVLVDGHSIEGEFGISIDNAVGLSETTIVEFSMFPNPANETLWISSDENLESISIIDMQGRNVISRAGMFREIDISQLATGMYQVAVSTSDRISYQKLILE